MILETLRFGRDVRMLEARFRIYVKVFQLKKNIDCVIKL